MKLQPEGQAVLAEIRRTGVDQIICLGDVATLGPQPNSVIEILGELDCPCILGNHDEFLLYPELAHSYSESPQVLASIEWSRGCLSADELSFIRSFRRHHEVPLGGDATLQLFHGTPRSNMEDVLATTPSDALDEMLGGMAATVMAGGHTHIQMLRQHHGNLLVNPGSVGLPFKDYVGGRTPTVLPHAEYALIEVSGGSVEVDLRRVPLDKGLLRVVQIDHRLRSWLLEQYL
jgi:predicted phosphodiesterase